MCVRERERGKVRRMEGQPRVRGEWRGGTGGVGVRSRQATAAGQRPGKRAANTSGTDSRASEPPNSRKRRLYIVVLRVLRSCCYTAAAAVALRRSSASRTVTTL